jgi:AraC family transcriptional regulator
MDDRTKFRNIAVPGADCSSVTTIYPEYPFSPPLGQRLWNLVLSDFALTESLYEPCSRVPAHAHLSPTIVLVLAGSSIERVASRNHELNPGSLILRPARETHSDRNGKLGIRCLNIEVNTQNCPLLEFPHVFSRPAHLRGGLLPAFAQRIYGESKTRDSAAPIVIEGLILEMLGHASRSFLKSAVRPPQWLEMSKDLCHARFAEALTLSEIAKTVGAHPTHLARAFKKHYGTTVGEYIRRLRLDWAANRLSNTDEPIAEIATAAGFYDQSHFTHILRKYLGASPLEFRATRNSKK